ncbi:AAA family ATPase [Alkalihalobacterium sp. APHAB7]|uniref:AAA family ATPase n=1 Tax=Alkalihalobacterium sp. APHAB7 TaxID=3402081 RepID=UPI003AAFBCF4
MKVKEIYLKGWRSYSNEDGISVNGLKHINLFIGPNNSGKSNLFKYLYFLRETILNKVQNDSMDYDSYNNLDIQIASRDTWADLNDDISCELLLEDIIVSKQVLGEVTLHNELETIRLVSNHNISESKTCLSVLNKEGVPLLEKETNKPKVYCSSHECYLDPREGIGYPYETVEYWNAFFESLIFVDPIRHYNRETASKKEADFDGSDIIEQIIELHNDESMATDYMDYKDLIEECLKTILLEESVSIDVTRDEVRFFFETR